MAGLAAAVTALETGAEVVVLEKGPRVGGSARLSAGYIWTFEHLDRLHGDIPHGNPLLQELVHSALHEDVGWIASLGVRVPPPRPILSFGRGWEVDPVGLVETMAERVRSLGGEILLETALDSLVTHDGAVVGVEVVRLNGDRYVEPGSVLLATGGFQGNPELVARYIAPSSSLYLRSNPWSTGDGFVAATRAGAGASTGLDAFYGHAMTAPPARIAASLFAERTQYYGMHSVALNLRGERFADESVGTGEEVLNQHLARQPGGQGFYVLDDRIADMDALDGLLLTRVVTDRAQTAGGPFVVAETLDQLCVGLSTHGVPGERALETLTAFNRCMLEERFDALCPPRERFRIALTVPPYVAVGVKAGITFSMGGLCADDELRVLRRSLSSSPMDELASDPSDYRPVAIPGLFAAGADVGDISHGGYLGGLATALTTGRTAGRSAAAVHRQAGPMPSLH